MGINLGNIASEIIQIDLSELDEDSSLEGLQIQASAMPGVATLPGAGTNWPGISIPSVGIGTVAGATAAALPIQALLDATGYGMFSENMAARGQELANVRPVDVSGRTVDPYAEYADPTIAPSMPLGLGQPPVTTTSSPYIGAPTMPFAQHSVDIPLEDLPGWPGGPPVPHTKGKGVGKVYPNVPVPQTEEERIAARKVLEGWLAQDVGIKELQKEGAEIIKKDPDWDPDLNKKDKKDTWKDKFKKKMKNLDKRFSENFPRLKTGTETATKYGLTPASSIGNMLLANEAQELLFPNAQWTPLDLLARGAEWMGLPGMGEEKGLPSLTHQITGAFPYWGHTEPIFDWAKTMETGENPFKNLYSVVSGIGEFATEDIVGEEKFEEIKRGKPSQILKDVSNEDLIFRIKRGRKQYKGEDIKKELKARGVEGYKKGGYVKGYQEGGFIENEYPGTYPIYPEDEMGGELVAEEIAPYEETPFQPDYDPGFQKTANTLEVPWTPWEGPQGWDDENIWTGGVNPPGPWPDWQQYKSPTGPSNIGGPNYDWNNDGTVDVLDAVGGQSAGWNQNMLQGLTNQIIPPGGQGLYPSPPGGGWGELTPNYNPGYPATPVTGEGQYLNPPAAQTAMDWTPGEGPTGYQELDPYAPGGGGVNPIIPEDELPELDPVYTGKSWGGAGGGYVPLNGFFRR